MVARPVDGQNLGIISSYKLKGIEQLDVLPKDHSKRDVSQKALTVTAGRQHFREMEH